MRSTFSLRSLAPVGVALLLALPFPAAHAKPTPALGTLKTTATSLTFTGAVYGNDDGAVTCETAPNPVNNNNPTPPCDKYVLTVDLPVGFEISNPNAVVHIDLDSGLDDDDLYVFDAAGNEVVSSASTGGIESVDFSAIGGSNKYNVDVPAFIGSGESYTARITLLTPDTAPPDGDGDGVPDANDLCPTTAPGVTVDANGCPAPADADGDGVPDSSDLCPNTPPGSTVDATGCVVASVDADGDGVADADDACPGTPAGTPVNTAGCPVNPTEPRCIAPGLTMLTDVAGDQVGSQDTDLISVKVSESVTSQRNLVFTVKMTSLASLTSNARRIATFKTKGADFYVAMINSAEATAPIFDYGTGTSGFGGTDSLGRGLTGSGYNTNGTFTVVAPLSAFGLSEGDVLNTFAAVVRLSGGACGAACLNGAAADTGTAPPANAYTLTTDGVCGVVESQTATPPAGLPPRFQIHASPDALGNDAGEPSVGINRKTQHSMFISYTQALRETYAELDPLRTDVAGATLPMACEAKWEDKSGTLTTVNSLDPILFTDEATGRTFNSQLSGDNSLMEYTDDDGENWTPAQAGPPNGGADHQAVATGIYPAGSVPAAASWPTTGPKRAVYYCSQSVATAFCSRSDDGGDTFGPGFPFKNTQCAAGALHGHVKVAPDGTAYVPDSSQCVLPTGDSAEHVLAFVSGDAGQTWAVRDVPFSTGGDGSDPSIGIATDGTAYMCYPNADSTVHVAVSGNKGVNWEGGQNVGAAEGLVQTRFPQMIAGDGDRAACAFLGTKKAGNGSSLDFKGVWYGYVATTYDRGKSWHLVNVTPNDPIQGYGGVGPDGKNRNLLDFNDLQIDEFGRTYFAFADGCIGGCVQDPSKNSFAAKATIVRQIGGRTLFAKYDATSASGFANPRYNPVDAILPASACARQDASTRDVVQSVVRWNAPDNGASPITDYKVYRSLDKNGPFALIGDAGTALEYNDSAVKPSVDKYYYRVEAYNLIGVAALGNTIELAVSTAVSDPCKLPGEIISQDALGDVNPAGPDDLDIAYLGVAETEARPDDFTITMKMANFTAGAPPQGTFYVILFPSFSKMYIALDSTNGPTTFVYGTFQEDPAGQGFLIYTQKGTLPNSTTLADGTIRFVVPRARFNNPPVGTVIPGFDARARAGASSANSRDTAGNVDYTVRGISSCTAPGIVIADLTASVTSGKRPLTVSLKISGAQSKGKKLASYSLLFGDETGSPPVPTTGSFGSDQVMILPHTYANVGTYRARLTVTDETGAISTNLAEETITVLDNQPPKALVAANPAVDEGTTVTLDGSASLEPDGDVLVYAWTQRSGPNVTLSDAANRKPTFTAPDVTGDTTLVFRLTVRDPEGLEDFVDTSVLVRDIPSAGGGGTGGTTPTKPSLGDNQVGAMPGLLLAVFGLAALTRRRRRG